MAVSFIAYRRSSTKKQTIGLEIQRASVEDYIQRNGGELIAWYEDVGRAAASASQLSKAQPALVRALAHSLNAQATLIVARLDRLTRSTAVLALTQEDGPPLLVVETPDASPFILQIYAAVAEEYRRQVSCRVKAGLAAAIAKGRDPGRHVYRLGIGNRRTCLRYAEQMRPIVENMRRWQPMSHDDVANELNWLGLMTIRERPWSADTVRLLWRWFHPRWSTQTFPGRLSNAGPASKAAARARAERLRILVEACRIAGATTEPAIMAELNKAGAPSPSGRPWSLTMTGRLLRQLK